MIWRLFKNPSFLIGFLFIFILLTASLLFPIFIQPHLPEPPSLLYENGNMVDKPPYPPSFTYWFGVDRFGDDIFWKVVEGAKYTIIIAIIVGLMRTLLGICGGLFYGFYYNKLKWLVEPFTRAFRFIPAVLIFIFFVGSMVSTGISLFLKQFLALALISFLPLMSVVGEEIHHYIKNEFMNASRLLGGSKWWMIRKHISQHLKPRFFILFLQQISQTLLLLVHLGVLHIFIGGVVVHNMGGLEGQPEYVDTSLSNEWAGLIGLSYPELRFDYWIVIGPGIGFFLTLLALNLMLRGLQKVLSERPVYTRQTNEATTLQSNEPSFSLVNQSVQS